MKRAILPVLLVFLVGATIGCAALDSLRQVDPYQAALASALIIDQSAQDAYKGVYSAWREGAVSDEDMEDIDRIYEEYDAAFRAVQAAAQAYESGGAEADIDALVEALKEVADRLNVQALLLGVIS